MVKFLRNRWEGVKQNVKRMRAYINKHLYDKVHKILKKYKKKY